MVDIARCRRAPRTDNNRIANNATLHQIAAPPSHRAPPLIKTAPPHASAKIACPTTPLARRLPYAATLPRALPRRDPTAPRHLPPPSPRHLRPPTVPFPCRSRHCRPGRRLTSGCRSTHHSGLPHVILRRRSRGFTVHTSHIRIRSGEFCWSSQPPSRVHICLESE